ncbi:hypothetical protein Aspvir_005997 [Aspergillus viridinutans]|uniref:Uncharacterized protein n=1 Tax=Aspergillus viridinutans TaxID=75553 RepID=A0A9P3BYJ6_ASPVI|nr:uncharacterized protein Aspvir_005997 [Aspergillus viridinutans]GIK01956.1 hypothetical protein Aspvir_005997 [Aspergillus viridinutans]
MLHASELDENQWESVLRNCGLMHGWTVDLERNIVKPAPRTASKTPAERPGNAPAAAQAKESSTAKTTDLTTKATEGQPSAAPKYEDQEAKKDQTQETSPTTPAGPIEPSTKVAPAKEIVSQLPKKANALPSFVVNDESKIAVSLVSHELQESMARNSFSSTSFESEASGGFKGFSVGVTGGNKSSTTEGGGPRRKQYSKRNLEPTEALRSAVDKVRRSKNINDLRALQAEFAHIFCHEVTVGGSLQTTRVTDSKNTASESRQKEEFKAQWFGKGLKQTGSNNEDARNEIDVSDMSAFEAKGGQTIIAANPVMWCASLLPFNNWRVIERSEPSLLATAISHCNDAKMANVKQWFLAAVPQLPQYLTIPPSRCLDVRLKLQSDIPGFTREVGDNNTPKEKQHHICNYLGHQFGKGVHPIRMGLKRREIKVTETKFGGGASFGMLVTDLTREFTQLKHGSLVALRSCHDKMNLYLTIFRNEQGVVLPAITDSGELPMWRVQKVGGSTAQYIKEGEPIRLCWRFSDQTCGFHNGAAMVISPSLLTKPVLTRLNVIVDKGDNLKDSITYNLFNVTFRIDLIRNHASSEIMDYMTRSLDQRTSTPWSRRRPAPGPPLGAWAMHSRQRTPMQK